MPSIFLIGHIQHTQLSGVGAVRENRPADQGGHGLHNGVKAIVKRGVSQRDKFSGVSGSDSGLAANLSEDTSQQGSRLIDNIGIHISHFENPPY